MFCAVAGFSEIVFYSRGWYVGTGVTVMDWGSIRKLGKWIRYAVLRMKGCELDYTCTLADGTEIYGIYHREFGMYYGYVEKKGSRIVTLIIFDQPENRDRYYRRIKTLYGSAIHEMDVAFEHWDQEQFAKWYHEVLQLPISV